ncbi:hypothetical protein QQ045_021895 [Rhodiola kirilowii]
MLWRCTKQKTYFVQRFSKSIPGIGDFRVLIGDFQGRAWINKASKVRSSVWKVSEKRLGRSPRDTIGRYGMSNFMLLIEHQIDALKTPNSDLQVNATKNTQSKFQIHTNATNYLLPLNIHPLKFQQIANTTNNQFHEIANKTQIK